MHINLLTYTEISQFWTQNDFYIDRINEITTKFQLENYLKSNKITPDYI